MTTRDVEALGLAIRENSGVKSIERTLKDLAAAAKKKGSAGVDRMLVTGFMAGAFVAFGAYLMLITGGNLGDAYPEGIQKLVCGLVFPLGIVLVVYCGTDLFTGNTLIMPLGNIMGTAPIWKTLKLWVTCYIGNLVGAVFVAFFFVYLLVDKETVLSTIWGQKAVKIAEAKMNKDYIKLIISGIGANWMVCTSVFIGARSREGAGKIIALWWPIFAFVCMGFEHCIANCFFIPLGMFFGAQGQHNIIYNLIFSTIGNIIGGSFFSAFILWYTLEGHVLWRKSFVEMFYKFGLWKHKDHDIESGNKDEEDEEMDDLDTATDSTDEESLDTATTAEED